jgi:chitinase
MCHRFCAWLQGNGSSANATVDPYFNEFAANADMFDAIHPTWWTLKRNAVGKIVLSALYGNPVADKPSWRSNQIVPNTTKGGKRAKLIPMIGYGSRPGEEPNGLATEVLTTALDEHVAEIVAKIVAYDYDGIDIDYEHLNPSLRDTFTSFIHTLRAKMPRGKEVSVAVGPAVDDTEQGHFDDAALAQIADHLHVMGYDFHHCGSPDTGPEAPLGWIRVVVKRFAGLNAGGTVGKMLLGVPNYGVIDTASGPVPDPRPLKYWLDQFGDTYATSTDHMRVCKVSTAYFVADERSPNATSCEGHVYFDDIDSLEQKVCAAAKEHIGGITLWTLGGVPNRPSGRSFYEMVRAHFPK